jgi:hypothetical protein
LLERSIERDTADAASPEKYIPRTGWHGFIFSVQCRRNSLTMLTASGTIIGANLRLADRCENLWNRGAQRNNKSGFKGVYYAWAPWGARIRVKGKSIDLGRFETREQASAAYRKAADLYHRQFTPTEREAVEWAEELRYLLENDTPNRLPQD